MADTPGPGRSPLDVRTLFWNVTASVVAAALVSWLGAAYQIAVVVFLLSLGLSVFYASRGRRRRQGRLGRVLCEPSSSRSAQRALKMVAEDLRDGGLNQDAVDAIDIITHWRRYPHSTLLAPARELLRTAGVEGRAAAHLLDLTLHEMDVARQRVKRGLAEYVLGLPSSSTLVLYGFSTAVLDALVDIRHAVKNPIWVIEDVQYGDASAEEHEVVAQRLRDANLVFSLVTMESFVASMGRQASPITTVDGRHVLVTSSTGFVGLIGCDSSDDAGCCLIPGVVAGQSSGTIAFVEQFADQTRGPRTLVVVSESYKMVETHGMSPVTTHAPVPLPLRVRAAHAMGYAIPFRGREVDLLRIRDEVSFVVTDRGTVAAPFSSGQLRSIRERWTARLRSDVGHGGSDPSESRGDPGTSVSPERCNLRVDVPSLLARYDQLPLLPEVVVLDPAELSEERLRGLVDLLREAFPEVPWTPEMIDMRVLTKSTLQKVAVLERSGYLLGAVTLHSSAAGSGRVHWLAVADEHRHHRYAQALILGLARSADQAGLEALVLSTERDKLEAVRLYQYLGFLEAPPDPVGPA